MNLALAHLASLAFLGLVALSGAVTTPAPETAAPTAIESPTR